MTDHASCPHADGVICAATLDDAAADPALTLEGAREMLRDAAAAIRHFHGLAPPALSDDWARGLRLAADALEAARADACVALVADIRLACGDNGKRMQPELVEFIRGLAQDAAKYRWALNNSRWIRGEHAAYVAIPVAREADLSCVAMRDAAIDQAHGRQVGDDDPI